MFSIFLIIISIISVTISIVHTPNFIGHQEHDREIISLLSDVEDSFVIISTPPNSYSLAYYSYAPIYFNLSTPDGWYRHMVSEEYLNIIDNMYYGFLDKDCGRFIDSLNKLGKPEVIAYKNDCNQLTQCGLKEKVKKQQVCLYTQ